MLLPALLLCCLPGAVADSARQSADAGAMLPAAMTTQSVVATQNVIAVETAAPTPRRLVLFGPPRAADGSHEITRAADGLFYVTAIVNGAAVRFLVDTGASIVVLRPEDARNAGIAIGEDGFTASASTANGKTAMARVTLDEVVVGDTRSQGVEAAVVRNNLPVSLLGQSWLSRLGSLTISGDRLRIQ